MNDDARLSVLEEQMKVSNNRIKDLEAKTDRIENLTLSVQKLAISVENMAREQTEYREKQNEMADRLLEVERKPEKAKAKRHDDVVAQLISLMVAALFGAILMYYGIR